MPLSHLTVSDRCLIDTYIDNFALCYDESPRYARCEDLNYILRFWDRAKKRRLLKLLDGKLILEKEISFTKSTQELMDDMEEAFDENPVFKDFRKKYADAIEKIAGNCWNDLWYNLNAVVSNETLAANAYRYHWRDFTVSFPNDDTVKPFKVSPGMKPMKIIAKIANYYGFVEEFEKFRIAHSMMLNQKTLTGTLCLSIHPLDYMTMSDNSLNWDSCMNWREPGEYRQGTVEMMNSGVVLVAYLKGNKPFEFTKGEYWNNKRWRTLVVVNDTLTVNVKGYPYPSSDLDTEVQKWVIELAEKNLGIKYYLPYEYDGESIFYSGAEDEENAEPISSLYFVDGMMYNDFGCLKDNRYHKIMAAVDDPCTWSYQMEYSGESECMWCGSETESMEEISVVCRDCTNSERCDSCGGRCDGDELVELATGDMVCNYCLDSYCSQDAINEEWYYTNGMKKVYLSPFPKGFVPFEVYKQPSIFLANHHFHNDVLDEHFKFGANSIKYCTYEYTWGRDVWYYVSAHELESDLIMEAFDMSRDELEEFKKDVEVPSTYDSRESIFDFVKYM